MIGVANGSRGGARRTIAHALAASVVAAAGLHAVPAAASECGGGAISARFSEAAQFCGGNAPAKPAETSHPAPIAALPVFIERPASVSVTMPGYATRLRYAAQAVRATGASDTSPLVNRIAARYRINPRLLASMMHTESAGRMGAISNKGALGLMQVMPGTARGLGVRDPQAMLHDPVLALSTGATYLKRLQAQLGNDVPLVVAAYNAGPGAVLKAGRKVPKYRETQGYVKSVMGRYQAPAR